MIDNFVKNKMGTVCFDGKFEGMRKPQEFIVYPLHEGDPATDVKVQSDTRIGFISLKTGEILMTPSFPSGAYGPHLAFAKRAGRLSPEELLLLKANVFATASRHAGTNGIVVTDNSAAANVFQDC